MGCVPGPGPFVALHGEGTRNTVRLPGMSRECCLNSLDSVSVLGKGGDLLYPHFPYPATCMQLLALCNLKSSESWEGVVVSWEVMGWAAG